jgi:hypothetical protein
METGKWVKMKVSATGVYKVTNQEIIAQGLNPNDIQVYGYGGAVLSENFSLPKADDLPQVPIYKKYSYTTFVTYLTVSSFTLNGQTRAA